MSLNSNLPETFVSGFHDENWVRKMEYKELGKTGMKVSKISIGGATFTSAFYGQLNEEEAIKTIQEAIRRGVNLIDTAPSYGVGNSRESETVLGKALQGIPRQAYYLSTKTGRYDRSKPIQFDNSYERTIRSVVESLKRLGVDYLDLFQIHDIEFAENPEEIINGSLKACEELRNIGKIRFIGINGYPLQALKEFILRAPGRIDTVLAYTRYTLVDDSLLEYLPFFREQNLGIINASSHSCGMLRNAGPPKWHYACPEVKALVAEAAEICKANGIELGKIAMYHALQLSGVDTHLTGIETIQLLDLNLDTCLNGLTEKEHEIYKMLIEKVFSRVPKDKKHWEGVELAQYWENVRSHKRGIILV